MSKSYRIYERPEDRLKEFLLPRLPGIRRWSKPSYSTGYEALTDVSFDVSRGETVGIVGRNGSGKSTLLQLICDTLGPTSGSIEVNGRVGALLELGAGFNPEFTGVENVYFSGTLHGLSRTDLDSRMESIAAFADIGDYLYRPVKTYSSGMYLRLAFALIAHIDADILVIDEALSVGDAYFVQKCMRFLRDFMNRGTLVFVSHDLAAVVNLCDRAVLLNMGRVEMIDTPKLVVERYMAALCDDHDGRTEMDAGRREDSGRQTVMLDDSRSAESPRTLESQIQVFGFHPESPGFGTGHARILSVALQDGGGRDLTWTRGGEDVNLKIVCSAHTPIARPIVGFQLKDRLGQVVFGDNTFLTYQHGVPSVSTGDEIEANFSYTMPYLPTGDYTFAVAIAEGTQDSHIQHHWLHDALLIHADATPSGVFGLVGIPMTRISLEARSTVDSAVRG